MNNENINLLDQGPHVSGGVWVWQVDPATGKKNLLVKKHNMILYDGATILSKLLAGKPNYKIYGMYVGYENGVVGSVTPKVIDKAYSQPFTPSAYTSPYGYLRQPLIYTPTFQSSSPYTDNIPVFTISITSATAAGGAAFTSGDSKIFEVALIAAPVSGDTTQDIVFSRTNFNQIEYDNSFNLMISWGIKFQS